ncbi:hypothetical protein CC80DRAFT_516713 [Byssothecium circinans]|uniref:Signal peptide-containing protein n=1 Tax=Byssothecium circinans TaxID=147558 RepID=A0A6A5TUT3_9PLEO|nr:hypothetical protein CC80DRAFT_516713 [Byssothecium circinans]
MAWFLRGVQACVFSYASCAPCTGYLDKKHRRTQAKKARKARTKLQLERPELYHHPEPTGTNPYWQEEIIMGPGPPPRRARRTNTGSMRAIATAETQSSAVSQGGDSFDVGRGDDLRLSDDTLDDDNWNHKRYQREDEDLWGSEAVMPLQSTMSGSSVGVAGITRPSMSRSESYCSARAPPVNDLHPPVVSLPSPHPVDNRWMLQPPPKASVMSGKERATNRSRSGSGASSRVELSLQRQVSARQLKHKLGRGEKTERPMSRGSSYSNLVSGQRHDRPKTPQTRPISAASSRRTRRCDTVMAREPVEHSSGDSSDTIIKRSPSLKSQNIPSIKLVRVRTSRQQLSTVMSSGSGNPTVSSITLSPTSDETEDENTRHAKHFSSTHSSDSIPYYTKHRAPLTSSDRTSLNVLQDLVSPRALLNTRFVSAPLIEARIKLPHSEMDEENTLGTDGETRVPFDSLGVSERDPRMRWSVDF